MFSIYNEKLLACLVILILFILLVPLSIKYSGDMRLAVSAPIVFAGGGGGGGGGGGSSQSIGDAISGIFGGIATAIGNAVSGISAAIGGLMGIDSGWTSTPDNSNPSQSALDSAPTVSNAQGTVVGVNSSGLSVVDTNGSSAGGLVAVGDGGSDKNGGNGVTPPPSGVCTLQGCVSASNACGDVGTGVTCVYSNGSRTACTAVTPTVSSFVGTTCTETITDTCGNTDYAFGTINCNNQCDITVYPPIVNPGSCQPSVCPAGSTLPYPQCISKSNSVCPAGFVGTPPNCTRDQCPSGTIGTYPNCTVDVCSDGSPRAGRTSCVGVKNVTIDANPSIVQEGGSINITWTSTEMDGCDVRSNRNNDRWNSPNGRETSSPILEKTTYTAICTTNQTSGFVASVMNSLLSLGTGNSIIATTTVFVVPKYQEI